MIYLFKNTIYTYLRNCPDSLFYIIDKALAPFQQGYFFSTKYKLGQWDGRVHLLHKQFSSFPTGLIDKVCRIIGTSGEDFKVVDKQTSPPVKERSIESLSLKGVELRPYQKRAIQICLEKERGILDLATNSGKCLTKGTYISLADGGIRPIEEIIPGKEIIALDSNFKQIVDRVVVVKKDENKVIYQIKTITGRQIKATSNHPFLTKDGFIRLSLLSTGDLIGIVREYRKLPFLLSLQDYQIILLAYHLGDGNYTNPSMVRFTNASPFILDEYRKVVERFENSRCIEDPTQTNASQYRLRRVNKSNKKGTARCGAHKFLFSMGLAEKGSKQKFIPSIIFQLSQRQLALFLNRYFCCDGCYEISGKKVVVSFSSSSKVMIYQVNHLLLRFGVRGSIRKRKMKKKFKSWEWTCSNQDSIKNFIKYIGIASKLDRQREIKEILAKRECGTKHDRLPLDWNELKDFSFVSSVQGFRREFLHRSNERRQSKITKSRGMKLIPRGSPLIKFLSKYIYWDEIIEIEKLPSETTYNLTTENHHNFIANEIYTHNTEIFIGLTKILKVPTLLLTHRKELLYQTSKRIQDRLGWKVNRIGDGLDESGQLVTVAMVQTLAKLPPKNLRKKLENYQLLVCDEVHHGGSALKTYCKVGMCCPSRIRIGLSGTPMTKNEVKDLRMVGMLGPTIMRISNADLVDEGFSAEPQIKMLTINQSNLEGLNYQDAYLQGIVHNSERNRKIFEAAKALDLSTLIIVQHIDHGRNLESLFRNGNCQFIWGEQDSETRQQALQDFQSGSVRFLISSVILDEGIDLPTIRHLILGAGGKSSIRTVQRLGRALRLDEGKEKVLITDFLDMGNSYLQSHSRRRKKDYEKEGFQVAIQN